MEIKESCEGQLGRKRLPAAEHVVKPENQDNYVVQGITEITVKLLYYVCRGWMFLLYYVRKDYYRPLAIPLQSNIKAEFLQLEK